MQNLSQNSRQHESQLMFSIVSIVEISRCYLKTCVVLLRPILSSFDMNASIVMRISPKYGLLKFKGFMSNITPVLPGVL